jgi:hypothetical protein
MQDCILNGFLSIICTIICIVLIKMYRHEKTILSFWDSIRVCNIFIGCFVGLCAGSTQTSDGLIVEIFMFVIVVIFVIFTSIDIQNPNTR